MSSIRFGSERFAWWCAMITPSSTNPAVTEVGDKIFRVCFIDPYQGYALADFAYNKLGLRKVAFLTDVASPYTVGVHKFFESHFAELGGEVVAQEGYTQGDTEFRAQLAKIKDSGADLLVHEATFADEEADRARETGHSTAREAATVASRAGVRQLVLTHFSARYSRDASDLLKEAREEFELTILARDGLEVEVPYQDEGVVGGVDKEGFERG